MFRFPVILLLCLLICPFTDIMGQVAPDSVSNTIQRKKKLVDGSATPDSLKPVLVADSTLVSPDSAFYATDSLKTDTLITQKPGYSVSPDSIEAPITYNARDSIVYDILEEKVYLYGEAHIKYKDIDLQAHFIILDWSNNTLVAVTDSANGEPVGNVIFKDGFGEYKAKKMQYNYQTKKGHVTMARTQEGEGFMILEQGKRNEHEELYGANAKYTTCELEDPHFYFKSKKVKVVPDKVMVTGPANLVVHDVPTPLVIPFGIFPTKKGRRSGIIMPRYGEQPSRGFYLQEGGYYFSISDYVDLAVTADFFTDLSWATRASTRYALRYQFRGDASFKYGRNRNGDPDSPDFFIVNDFRFNWNHQQDPKARPNSRFTANVNFGTSTFNKNFTFDQQSITQSLLVSKISYTRSFNNKPLSMSVNLDHNQNLQTGVVNLTLPELHLGTTRIQPFKGKSSGKRKWYESLGFTYTFNARNTVQAVDSNFISRQTLDDMKYGARHNVPVSASIPVFKYFTLTPNFTYTERWYFKTIDKTWDPTIVIESVNDTVNDTIYGQVFTDTINKFAAARDFNMGMGLTTNLYGYLRFKKGKLKAIRHKMTPTLSFEYRPDFGKERWGYYKEVQTDTSGNIQRYSIFQPSSSLFGAPLDGQRLGVGLNINNNLEMKVFSAKDTVNQEKKIKLIENLSIRTFYDFVKDSLNLDPITFNGFTTLFDVVRVTFNTTLDPYMYDSLNRRVNTFVWQDRKRFTQLRSASISLNTSIRSKQGGNQQPTSTDPYDQRNLILAAPNLYYDFTIPWSIGLGYNLSMTRGVTGNPDTIVVSTNSLTLDLDITLTPKWKLVVNTGYDFKEMDLVYTTVRVIRNMHCWELSFFWVPYPIDRMNYNMQLNVKSAILQELKLSRKSGAYSGPF